MKPASFDYVAVDSVAGAVAALAAHAGDAKIIAGGQSLVPMLNFRLLRPAFLVDINRIEELRFLEETGDTIRIGALTRHRMLETSPVIRKHLPILAEAMKHVAHLAIRNRGTIGGSLSHADPAAELPMMTALLDARLSIASPSGTRVVGASDFFLGALTTVLGPDEILAAVEFPKLPTPAGWDFQEVARRSGDFALAAAGAILVLTNGTIAEARIGLMGVDETPLRAVAAERLLIGTALDAKAIGGAVAAIRAAVHPNTDLHASSDYRRRLIGVLASRALTRAFARAQGTLP